MEPLLTSEDVSKMLQISLSTVHSWVFYRRIPFLKIGRLIRFRPSDIAKILEEGLPRVDDKKKEVSHE